jgi:STE24 endopeptidase
MKGTEPLSAAAVGNEAAPTDAGNLEAASPEVKRYQAQKRNVALVTLAFGLVLMTAAAFWFGPAVDWLVRAVVGNNAWLRLIGIGFFYAAALELLTLPLDFWSGFMLEHRYQLSTQTFAGWVWKRIKGYLVGGPLGLVMLLGLYVLLWYGGRWWWLAATAGFLGLTLVLGRILPVLILPLFYKVTRLDDATLADRLRRLADGTGLSVEGVYRLHLSEETRKANAALAGLGRSRRVLLGDTLLDGFTPDEIEVVFAHEVGHHVHRHLVKMVAVSIVLTAGGLWLVDVVLRAAAQPPDYAGFDDPAALPLVMLVLAVFGLLLSPALNALSRFFEVQCDRYALERTGLREAYRSAFAKLARLNKSDPDPHPLVVWLFYDHPPIRERLALADTVSAA